MPVIVGGARSRDEPRLWKGAFLATRETAGKMRRCGCLEREVAPSSPVIAVGYDAISLLHRSGKFYAQAGNDPLQAGSNRRRSVMASLLGPLSGLAVVELCCIRMDACSAIESARFGSQSDLI